MEVSVIINTKNATKEDIRSLLQKVKVWDMLTPTVEITDIRFVTDTEIPEDVAKSLYEGIFEKFDEVEMEAQTERRLLSLGSRGITVGGQLIGTCEELSLTLEEATEEDIEKLQGAESISLVRIRKG